MELAAVVVLYNTDEDTLLENINSYLHDVSFLSVVDNSFSSVRYDKLAELISKFGGKIEYIRNDKNLGIAEALNLGAKSALNKGYKWLLTMDQDSKVTDGMIQTLLNCIGSGTIKNIGLISPVHLQQSLNIQHEQILEDFEERLTVMTSGNIINLQVFEKLGGFQTKLFIDYVDHEYCLRLNKNGYKIVVVKDAVLIHNLGNFKRHTLGNVSNHNYIRRYYITRNRLFVQKSYMNTFPTFCKQDYKEMWKEIGKVVLYEGDKKRKLYAFILGYYHYAIGKFGELKFK